MSDLIRRQDAVSRMSDLLIMELQGQRLPTWNEVYRAMNDVPSAEPERKKGRWIEQDDSWDGVYYECSVCKEAYTLIDGTPSDNLYHFCPNCGADMRYER